MAKSGDPSEAQIRAYKTILAAVLDQRPSGTRQRLADAIGKHRSFVTQITSPSYATPIPQKHVATILSVCHLSPAEHDGFLAAYRSAHGDRTSAQSGERRMRHLTVSVPDLGDAKSNAAFDKAVSAFMISLGGVLRQRPGNE